MGRKDPPGPRAPKRQKPVPSRRRKQLLAILCAAVSVVGGLAFHFTGATQQFLDEDTSAVRLATPARAVDSTAISNAFSGLDRAFRQDHRTPLMTVRSVLGPAADFLLDVENPHGIGRGTPSTASDLFGGLTRTTTPEPVPQAPTGAEPLLASIHVLSDATGTDLPTDEALRLQIAALHLAPQTEAALARLLLAYTRASELEEHAVRALDANERLLLDRDPTAVQRWMTAKPGRSVADLETHLEELAAARIDLESRVLAADLLVRTIDLVKDDLALPPRAAADLAHAPPGLESAGVASLVPALSPGAAATAAANPSDAWGRVAILVAASNGYRDPRLPPLPQESLHTAVRNLAWVLGYPSVHVPLEIVELPVSLSNALATIVTARRIGLQTHDPTIHSLLVLDATRRAEPTLRAWGALIDLRLATDAARQSAAAIDLVRLAQHNEITAASVYGSVADTKTGTKATAPPTLADALLHFGMPGTQASSAARAFPPLYVAGATAAVDAITRYEDASRRAFSSISAEQRAILLDSGGIAALLERPRWTATQANRVIAWAEASEAFHDAGGPAALNAARAELLDGLTFAVDQLDAAMPSADLGDFSVMQSSPSSLCSRASPLAQCDNDVILYSGQDGGLVITGSGSSVLDGRYGNPRLVIDLGGNDVHLNGAGGGAPGFTSIVLELGGDDSYTTDEPIAQGAAMAVGAVGILWDRAGNDVYEHTKRPGVPALAQGAGGAGGLGMLIDEGGADEYRAPGADAHGAGIAGIGVLLDLGDGHDLFHADRGQGYASGTGTGVLVSTAGSSTFTTTKRNNHFQGGLEDSGSGLGFLLDFGGRDTQYSNSELPEGATQLSASRHPGGRGDDALWTRRSPANGLALGIDSTLTDEDGDGFANLVELAFQSDPDDARPEGRPGAEGADGIVEILEGTIGEPPNPDELDPSSLLEGGGFGDGLLCATNKVPCDDPISILQVNSTGDDTYARTAHIHVDLGGRDRYTGDVAGPGHFFVGGAQRHGVGSLAIDVDGNDVYDSDEDWTQASVEVYGTLFVGTTTDKVLPAIDAVDCAVPNGGTDGSVDVEGTLDDCEAYAALVSSVTQFYADYATSQGGTIGSTRAMPPVSMLVDARGDDYYRAGRFSQGAAVSVPQACAPFGSLNAGPHAVSGAAWLLDVSGNDEYAAADASQGAARYEGGTAGLLDLAGDDRYAFVHQGTSSAAAGLCNRRIGIVFDGGGMDHYNSTALAIETNGLQKGAVDAIRTQGDVQHPTTVSNEQWGRVGAFIDNGESFDTYETLNLTGQVVDVSALKNDVTVAESQGARFASIFSDGTAWFADSSVAEDPDEDAGLTLLERLAGSNPRDPDNNLGSVWTAPERFPDAEPTPEGILGASGLDDQSLWVRIPGLLAIGGRGDKELREDFQIVISLGGKNVYASRSIAASVTSGVVLLVDADEGDTTYEPDTTLCGFPASGSGQACPSVGGAGLGDAKLEGLPPQGATLGAMVGAATAGIAVLADAGGVNKFRTTVDLDVVGEGPRTYQILTQGAAAHKAVGVVVTWNSSNTFEANLVDHVKQKVGGAPLSPTFQGVAQGAATRGVGVLANLGFGDDTYSVTLVTARNVPLQGVAQGAAYSRITRSEGPATDPSTYDVGAIGILIDGGGHNVFRAPDGYSQGFGHQGIGILQLGAGRDELFAGPFSQGNGNQPGGLGLLYDIGGSDDYNILDEVGANEVQGSGRSFGVGLLIDEAGDDRYLAPSSLLAQGSGVEGHGAIIDLGGSDLYRARGESQAFVNASAPATPQQPQSGALLFDLHGSDVYELSSDYGQAGAGITCAHGNHQSLFIDAEGDDTYRYPGSKFPSSDKPPNSDGNDGAWTQPATNTPGCPFGVGVDAAEFGEAMDAISETVPVGIEGVTLEAWSGPTKLGQMSRVGDTITLRATVNVNPSNEALVERVAFTSDSGLIANGKYEPQDDGGLRYEYDWPTDELLVPDGLYRIHVAAYLKPHAEGSESMAPSADLPAFESGRLSLIVDNPPRLAAKYLETVLRISPGQGNGLRLQVDVGRDHQRPSGIQADPACDATDVPGGQLRVELRSPDHEFVLFDGYCEAGIATIPVRGVDAQGKPWPDGTYKTHLLLRDSIGQTNLFEAPAITIDGKAPLSRVALTDWANRVHRGTGGSTLVLPWEVTDFGGSGAAELCIFGLDANRDRTASFKCFPGPQDEGTWRIGGVATGQTLWFLPSAIDVLGNAESPCVVGEPTDDLCYRAKASDPVNVAKVRIDFLEPIAADVTIAGLAPEHAVVRPGEPVRFALSASDEGSGVADVLIELPDLPPITMSTDDHGTFWFDDWNVHNHGRHIEEPREEIYTVAFTVNDVAGNQRTESFGSILDSLPPRVTALEPSYQEAGDGETILLAGRPGGIAIVRALVEDASVASLSLDTSTISPVTRVECSAPEGFVQEWRCEIPLKPDLADTDYEVPFTAQDQAGNVANDAQALLRIRGQPTAIENLVIEDMQPRSFKVRWTTAFPTTGRVDYGRTAILGSSAEAGTGLTTEHLVEVTDLSPSTAYHFQAVSVNEAGRVSVSPLFPVTTPNAYRLDLLGFPDDGFIAGDARFDFEFTPLEAGAAATIDARLRDVGRNASPTDIAQLDLSEGSATIAFDTTQFADGDYRLVFHLDRDGDVADIESPMFHIDNTAPSVRILSPRPASFTNDNKTVLEFVVTDPNRIGEPEFGAITASDGNTPIDVEVLLGEALPGGALRRIEVAPTENLTDGLHRIQVSIADEAGNVGAGEYIFTVDTTGPRPANVTGQPRPGPEAARPGGSITVTADFVDNMSIASASVRTSIAPGRTIPLFRIDDVWQADITLPMLVDPDGVAVLPVFVNAEEIELFLTGTDALGNEGPTLNVKVPLDVDEPSVLDVQATVNHTVARVTIRTDEPTIAWRGSDDIPAPSAAAAMATEHVLTYEGLVPGTENVLEFSVADHAGHVVSSSVEIHTTIDADRPRFEGSNVQLQPVGEGIVRIVWPRATDNVGLRHYTIERSGGDAMIANVPASMLSFLDESAPAGRVVKYRVTPVDIAGLRGDALEDSVKVPALPRLSRASVSPENGPSTTPFVFRVEYRHAGGEAPQQVTVTVDDQMYVLSQSPASAPCIRGCVYDGAIFLPPSSLWKTEKPILFSATTDGEIVGLVLAERPFVKSPNSFEWAGDAAAAPTSSALAALFILAVTAILCSDRTRRRTE